MNRTFTIQLTKEFDATAPTPRFYEDEGLIAPERRELRETIKALWALRVTLEE
jgi:hypothetical protein